MKDGESVVWIGGLRPVPPTNDPLEREARRWRQMMAQENIVEFDGDPTERAPGHSSDDAA